MVAEERMFVVQASGRDGPGLVQKVTGILARGGYNIVDIEQTVIRGLFSIVMLVEPPPGQGEGPVELQGLREEYKGVARETGLLVDVVPYSEGRRRGEKENAILTIIGKDRPGIVHSLSEFMASHGANIHKIKMIARGDLIAMEMRVDVSDFARGGNQALLFEFRKALQDSCEELGLSHVFQLEGKFEREKKLIVFDMDSTLVDGETINRIAEETGFGEQVAELTRRAMEGELPFREALKERVKMLRGVKYEVLERIADSLELTPGAAELVDALKTMGYKLALISGGFTVFTEKMKEKLKLDYAFGNKLVIENGVLTGEVDENLIIDGKKKGEIIQWLATVEKISPDQIVAVGDGDNDRFMLENAGLGIGFRPKDVLKAHSDGILSQNLFGILYCLGLPDKKIDQLAKKAKK
ncbi:MAG: phosphoserine phosphatase SerB [Promethearchaeota archaeon]